MTARALTLDDIPEIARQVARELRARRPRKPRRVLPLPTPADVDRVRAVLRKKGARV